MVCYGIIDKLVFIYLVSIVIGLCLVLSDKIEFNI